MTLRAVPDSRPVGDRVRVFPAFPDVVVSVILDGRRDVRLANGVVCVVSVRALIAG